jgi:hypothetical protein
MNADRYRLTNTSDWNSRIGILAAPPPLDSRDRIRLNLTLEEAQVLRQKEAETSMGWTSPSIFKQYLDMLEISEHKGAAEAAFGGSSCPYAFCLYSLVGAEVEK